MAQYRVAANLWGFGVRISFVIRDSGFGFGIVCLARFDACANLAAMKPGESDQAQRRVAIYFVVMPAVILAPLFFAFWLLRQSSPGGDELARVINSGKGYYEQ